MTDRCTVGQTYWDQAHDYRKPPSYRKGAWVEWQDHRHVCAQCCEAEAEEWQKAANAKIYDWDLQEAK